MIKLIKLWIMGSAACVSAGWLLSAARQINFTAYAILVVLLTVALVIACVRRPAMARASWVRWRPRRFRRTLPFLFLLMSGLAALGGLLHAPNNYDALTYRFSRVLHWWATSGWHWIQTPDQRMNYSGTAFEWLMMPLFVLTHSDRLFFLINVGAYLLLPSLIYLVFTTGGLSRRVAWFWMWLLPAALCFAMQAGSISNDTIASTYFLSAIYFGFQARRCGSVQELWLAFLSAGLLTAVKGSNLPLLLPVAFAIAPALPLAEKRLVSTIVVILVSLLVSFLPTAILNQRHANDWTGDPYNFEKMKVQKPVAGILGNGLQLGLQSLEPPFLPLASTVEIWVWDRLPGKVQTVLRNNFPRFSVGFRELPQEESAGVGVGITIIVLLSIVAAWRFRSPGWAVSAVLEWKPGMVIGVLTWIALLAYMSKVGSESTSRLISAYYPLLLLPLLMNRAQRNLIKRRWFNILAICAFSVALYAIILTPSRPLWPARTFFDWAVREFPENKILAHARVIYSVYRNRSDVFASFRQIIPASVRVIGVIQGSDDAESCLWRPFGSRRVVEVVNNEQPPEWVVVKNSLIEHGSKSTFDQWLQKSGAVLVAQQEVTEKASFGPETWSIVRFSDPGK